MSVACAEKKAKDNLFLSLNSDGLPERALSLVEFESLSVPCKESINTDGMDSPFCMEFYLDQTIGVEGSDGFNPDRPAYYFQDVVDKAIVAFSGEEVKNLEIVIVIVTRGESVTIHGLDTRGANFNIHIISESGYL